QKQRNRCARGRQLVSFDRLLPELPQAERYKQVRNDEPDVQELVVRKHFLAELEEERQRHQAEDRQHHSSLKPRRSKQCDGNRRPLETECPTEIRERILRRRIFNRVTPMEQRIGCRMNVASLQVDDLRQSNECSGEAQQQQLFL